ncbi:E3 ubiquitin- ligase TRIM39-like [Olea europaea subsp. europaea]|uniref:E3 ubiquitin-protein ligase RMA n=1 Tax=Olea europaea subsp. europaea TaxID=158383 RepID=A0A8S0UWJ0_OLEEU|nr:E3 ubiquitin- ligase TRIM39-like [Olea europaea subsp. europaea]
MADETSPAMNFDLNLGPLENWGDATEPGSGSNHNSAFELIGENGLQLGEGSAIGEERNNEVAKTLENGNGYLEDEALRKKGDGGMNNGVEGSFFDCNICLELAKEPVVTCCGHLFCWPCLYHWLHHHSYAEECPVCKGEVTTKNVIPIYGSGSIIREHDVDSRLNNIPLRPQASRFEGWRQIIQRNASIFPMEEMIDHLGSTFELSQESVQNQSRNSSGPRESHVRYNSFLNQFMTSRGARSERAALPFVDMSDLIESSPANNELRSSRLSSYLRHRSSSNRTATLPNLQSGLSSDEIQVARWLAEDSYLNNNPVERNQEQAPAVNDRDSLSSIAAVIRSESQSVDNAIEIDSRVLLSTSSSRTRRRNDTSRTSDVDGGDSRARRRRRLTDFRTFS